MNDNNIIKYSKPIEIENRSFEIIENELGTLPVTTHEKMVIKRVIHTTADFEYAKMLKISKNAVEAGVEAFTKGCTVITDTKMAWSGINKKTLESLGCKAVCFIDDKKVSKDAKRRGITRSAVSMEKASMIKNRKIFAVGNAPTALITLYNLARQGKLEADLIIGVPVGFVNVIEAKQMIMELDIPYIVSDSRKGGSNVAAAIINALMYIVKRV